jgi:uncharacterized protein (TIGR03790 family)
VITASDTGSLPPLSTNSIPSAFFDSHPELARPLPPKQDLTLHPSPPAHVEGLEARPELPSPPTLTGPGSQANDLVNHLLVVYNQNDSDSKDLASYYAARRHISADHILSIACSTKEEITRSEYNETIREPIISYLCQKNWITRRNEQVPYQNRMLELLMATHNDIWAMVLMRGVPLKIAPDPSDADGMQSQQELATNAAAVDSELALLPIFGLPLGGLVLNSFFDADMTRLQHAGPELALKIILVTRLDGPKPKDVRRMIDDSIYAENNRLAGLAVIDTRGLTDVKNVYTIGDVWLRRARDLLVRDGWTVKFDDKGEVLPATDPCNQVALYLGWYAGDAVGPWITPPNRFVPGAIAYHLHSYSASTVRSETRAWVGPLISHGAAATMGTVYEPYIDLTPHEDIFTLHLLAGNSFAEAAYASIKGLSWMTTVVGDPLYRPFRQPLAEALAQVDKTDSDHHDWLLLQQLQSDLAAGKITASVNTLKHFLNVPGTGAVAQEGLGDLLEKSADSSAGDVAVRAYQNAITLDALPMDRIRIGLKLAQHYANHGQDEQAGIELTSLRDLYPEEAERFGLSGQFAPVVIPSANSTSDRLPAIPTPEPASSSMAPPPGAPQPPGPPKP